MESVLAKQKSYLFQLRQASGKGDSGGSLSREGRITFSEQFCSQCGRDTFWMFWKFLPFIYAFVKDS